jgi:hypothetical protein
VRLFLQCDNAGQSLSFDGKPTARMLAALCSQMQEMLQETTRAATNDGPVTPAAPGSRDVEIVPDQSEAAK